jgi:hypothetical protein
LISAPEVAQNLGMKREDTEKSKIIEENTDNVGNVMD